MSPRKRIAKDEVESLLPILNGLSGFDKELAAECKDLLVEYLQIDPNKANYRFDGADGAPLLAYVIAQTHVGCEILFDECAKHLDSATLNFLINGRSLLSYLTHYNNWCSVLYTEKNFEMIDVDAFNFGGNMAPASIVLLTHFPEMFLEDFISVKFQPLKCKEFMGHKLFEKLLSTPVGISVLLKHREIRDVLNDHLSTKRQGISILRNRLDERPCQILKNTLAKEAKSSGYDNASNLFQSAKSKSSDTSYQNNHNNGYH